MEAMYLKHTNPRLRSHDLYEVRPRKDKDGFDLISNLFRYGPDLVCWARRCPLRNRVCKVLLSFPVAPRSYPRLG
jgi:hypothetical protein